ncbi:PLP-dependent aminotransferase family protein [Roseateles asaccharophilus]|uniref:GntR family transcriptional regulator/MocR family aminotransferase n=1 Tax=Roseateles asaccharophilus TaxID=582607 RepID=A0ABU2AFD4_9BURK|nr:PLP-dependent aminotransferase family protein [Roseateles asaccharophilus]MDR7335934.1 GntR family transcriptional regulator/MocR family aminotransferase [Roseateles asaccharophilus]
MPRTFDADRIDSSLFPAAVWSRLEGKRVRAHGARPLQCTALQGLAALRGLIAQHLLLTRGLACDLEQIVIVQAAHQAIDLLARLLLNPNEEVWIEDPGSTSLKSLLASTGARVVPVPVDEDGLRVDEGVLAAPRARMACTTTGVQMPLGLPLSAARRESLLSWARAAGAYVLDEDREGDVFLDGHPPACLKAIDTHDRVIHVGHLDASMGHGVRLGYLVLPRNLVDPVCAAMAITQTRPSLMDQAVLHDFMADGHWSRHLHELRAVYRGRADALRHNLDKHFGRWLRIAPAQRGLNVTAWLPTATRDADIARRAADAGVSVTPLSAYRMHHPVKGGLRLGFAAFSEPNIHAGVLQLARALDGRATPQVARRSKQRPTE